MKRQRVIWLLLFAVMLVSCANPSSEKWDGLKRSPTPTACFDRQPVMKDGTLYSDKVVKQ